MKYIRLFENSLDSRVIDCFDIENTDFRVKKSQYGTQESLIEVISISTYRPEFFELDEDLKDDIISGIEKSKLIGYKLHSIRMYNGIVSNMDYYSVNTFSDFKNPLNFDSRKTSNGIPFKFNHLTRISIFFQKAK